MPSFFQLPLLWLALLLGGIARAQSPTLDPNFYNGEIYQPGAVNQALRQPDGKTLLVGPFQRVLGQSTSQLGQLTSQLVRLQASGTQLDQPFQDSIAALQGNVDHLLLLPSGQLLLLDDATLGATTSGELTLRGVTRRAILRLNANGSPDAGFDAQLSSAVVLQQVLPQPDGKLLLLGLFRPALGQPGPVLIRLNADGSRDNTFQAAAFTINSVANQPTFIGLQADGKVLVAGTFDSVGGQARRAVARLLSTGALDAAFIPVFPITHNVSVTSLAQQPDGKILLLCDTYSAQLPSIRRLQATGTEDISFTYTGPWLNFAGIYKLAPVLQPDGRILVATRPPNNAGTFAGQVLRFTATGDLDYSFDNTGAAVAAPTRAGFYPGSVQLLPNGQILIASGHLTNNVFAYPPLAAPVLTGVALLRADGTRDAAFDPQVQDFGTVLGLALQPDGKILIGGRFSEVHGVAARNLARLLPTGVVDASFSASADDEVSDLALQPDGKVVVAGRFDYLNGSLRPALGRLLPTGARDAAFAPPVTGSSTTSRSSIYQVLLRPTGEVLALGYYSIQRSGAVVNRRLTQFQAASGQEDSGFQTAMSTDTYIANMLLQPGGKLVLAGNMATGVITETPIWRLLPTGALDATFNLSSSANPYSGVALGQDGAGRIYLGGAFDNLGAPGNHNFARFLADGQPDPTFQVVLPGYSPTVRAIVVQPNGRVLLGGQLSSTTSFNAHVEGTLRLLPTGAPDSSYNPALGPVSTGSYGGDVHRLVVQPNGAILAAGIFPQVGSLPLNGLVRLLDANVLAVHPGRSAPATAAWPVPAHAVLHLALDAASRPRQVQLLDALGRVVLTQPVTAPELSLNTAGRPPGVYLLRVRYDVGGTVTRRVAIE